MTICATRWRSVSDASVWSIHRAAAGVSGAVSDGVKGGTAMPRVGRGAATGDGTVQDSVATAHNREKYR